VKTTILPKTHYPNSHNPFREFFGDNWWGFGHPQQGRPQKSAGSGVIISPDGYIITNNHVINRADEIEVVLFNKSKYTAKVIGTDPSTDLALLKIDEANLPYIRYGNSDSVEAGQWVMAVGNPFNLASTVTAGIVSAKGRNIHILEDNFAIESFIQTDAAVNPGNSGGALVNMNGKLIGINTAIATPTGAYAGYSFAIPANLVHKVIEDLKNYGIVQRGFLGVSIRNVDNEIAEEFNLLAIHGVYVAEVLSGSASDDAGIESGDIILSVNGVPVNSSPQLQEQVGRYRPGDELSVVFLRNGKERSVDIVLKNKNHTTDLVTKETVLLLEALGIQLEELSDSEKEESGISSGIKVSKVTNGKVRKYTDMQDGFIITRVNKQPVNSIETFIRILENKNGGVMIEGIYPDYPASTYYYAFGL